MGTIPAKAWESPQTRMMTYVPTVFVTPTIVVNGRVLCWNTELTPPAYDVTASGNIMQRTGVAIIGDSIDQESNRGSFLRMAVEFARRGGYYCAYNAAVGGHTSTHAKDVQLPLVLANAAPTGVSECWIKIGTNDSSGSYSTTLANIAEIVRSLRAAGIIPRVFLPPPKTGSSSDKHALCAYIWCWCRYNNVWVSDPWSIYRVAGNAWADTTKVAPDGTHPYGEYIAGAAQAAANHVLGSADYGEWYPYAADGIVGLYSNPLLSSSSGGVGTGLSVVDTTLTSTRSVESATIGNRQKVDLGTATVGNSQLFLQLSAPIRNKLLFVAKVSSSGTAGYFTLRNSDLKSSPLTSKLTRQVFKGTMQGGLGFSQIITDRDPDGDLFRVTLVAELNTDTPSVPTIMYMERVQVYDLTAMGIA